MANEFKIKKGLLVNGSGSVIVSVDGSQGQLFSVTDSLEGILLSVTDISGIPILDVSSDNTVKMGTFNNEGLIVTGSNIRIQTPITTGSVTHIPVFTNNPTSSNQLLRGITPSVFISQSGIAITGSNTFTGNQTVSGSLVVTDSINDLKISRGEGNLPGNIAIGNNVLSANTTGDDNLAIGTDSLVYNTTGYANTAYGYGALFNNTSGEVNTAIGPNALVLNQTGSYNTAIGYQTGYYSGGSNNIYIGNTAGPNSPGFTVYEDNKLYINTTPGTPLIGGDFAARTLTIDGTTTIQGALTAQSLIVNGGTSSQFLKGDGSLDATAYQPLLTNPITGSGTNGTIAVWSGGTSLADSVIQQSTDNRILVVNPVNTSSRLAVVNTSTGTLANSFLYAATTGNRYLGFVVGGQNRDGTTAGLSNASLAELQAGGDSSAMLLNAAGNFPMVFAINQSERMRITSSGNVGIGTTNPESRLDIGNGTLTVPTLKGRTYTLTNISSQNPNFINGTGFNSIPVRVGDIIDLPFGQTRTVVAVTDTQITVNTAWGVSFGGANAEGRGGMVFVGNNAERMRITAGGDLLIGTISTAQPNISALQYLGGGGTGTFDGVLRLLHNSNNVNGSGFIDFWFNSVNIGAISQSGTTGVAYNTTSDYRLKHSIQPMLNALEKIEQLNPVSYKWNADNSDGEGFIAHELQEIIPYAVTGEKDGEMMQGVDYSRLTPLLVKAIQEQQLQIEELKAKLNNI
jgi:trimeric autotransporter adhesin